MGPEATQEVKVKPQKSNLKRKVAFIATLAVGAIVLSGCDAVDPSRLSSSLTIREKSGDFKLGDNEELSPPDIAFWNHDEFVSFHQSERSRSGENADGRIDVLVAVDSRVIGGNFSTPAEVESYTDGQLADTNRYIETSYSMEGIGEPEYQYARLGDLMMVTDPELDDYGHVRDVPGSVANGVGDIMREADERGADIVLFVVNAEGCGAAFPADGFNPEFKNWAIAAITANPNCIPWIVPHEFGHLNGVSHQKPAGEPGHIADTAKAYSDCESPEPQRQYTLTGNPGCGNISFHYSNSQLGGSHGANALATMPQTLEWHSTFRDRVEVDPTVTPQPTPTSTPRPVATPTPTRDPKTLRFKNYMPLVIKGSTR